MTQHADDLHCDEILAHAAADLASLRSRSGAEPADLEANQQVLQSVLRLWGEVAHVLGASSHWLERNSRYLYRDSRGASDDADDAIRDAVCALAGAAEQLRRLRRELEPTAEVLHDLLDHDDAHIDLDEVEDAIKAGELPLFAVTCDWPSVVQTDLVSVWTHEHIADYAAEQHATGASAGTVTNVVPIMGPLAADADTRLGLLAALAASDALGAPLTRLPGRDER